MTNLRGIFDGVIEEMSVKPPIAVLKELAQELEERTQGLLVGKIEQTVYQDHSFILDFYITAPSLNNNYSYQVLKINHDIDFYPLKVTGSEINSSLQAKNQKEFEDILKFIISTPQVKRVINGLSAQIKSA